MVTQKLENVKDVLTIVSFVLMQIVVFSVMKEEFTLMGNVKFHLDVSQIKFNTMDNA